MPPSRLLALLQGLQSAAPDLNADPPPPSNRLGLFGGGYRAHMAGLGASGMAPALRAGELSTAPPRQAMQLASNGVCTSCHTGAPPPPALAIHLPELEPLPPLPAPGGWASLLPPPLGGLVSAGQLARSFSGPQTSLFVPPRDPPQPPSSGGGSDERSEGRPQCEMQERTDRAICAEQPTKPAKAVCYSNIAARFDHCERTGEIGGPSLFRAKRKDGRFWRPGD